MATDIEVIVDPAAVATAVTIDPAAVVASITLTTGSPGPQGEPGPAGSDATVTEQSISAALGFTPQEYDQSLNTTDNVTFNSVTSDNFYGNVQTGAGGSSFADIGAENISASGYISAESVSTTQGISAGGNLSVGGDLSVGGGATFTNTPSVGGIYVVLDNDSKLYDARTPIAHTHPASDITDFAASVRGIILTGLSTATSTAIAATDSVLSALGKLQAQVSALASAGYQTAAQVTTAITSYGYQTASQVTTAITSYGYQTAAQVTTAITSYAYQTAAQVSSAITTALTNASLSGTNNIAISQQALSGSSLMTRDLVDSRIFFGGPYFSPLSLINPISSIGAGGTNSSNGNVYMVGNGASPTAGVTSVSAYTPATGLQFVSADNGFGAASPSSGTGGVINFTQPFAVGFFIELRNNQTASLDVISRVWFGGTAAISGGIAGGINNAGFGVRIWRATSTTYNVALYVRTVSTTTTNISGATNANPIVITCNGHGLQNGDQVEITGVGGNTNANGIRTVANRTTNTFELSGIAGNAAYTSGGVANKISSPITITAGRVRRMFFYNRGDGTLELHFGAITNTPAITLSGLSLYSTTPLPSQLIQFGVSQQSVTDATAYASTVVSNMMLIQP